MGDTSGCCSAATNGFGINPVDTGAADAVSLKSREELLRGCGVPRGIRGALWERRVRSGEKVARLEAGASESDDREESVDLDIPYWKTHSKRKALDTTM